MRCWRRTWLKGPRHWWQEQAFRCCAVLAGWQLLRPMSICAVAKSAVPLAPALGGSRSPCVRGGGGAVKQGRFCLRVARLQNEVGTSAERSWHEIFLSRHEFSRRENAQKISPKFWSLYFAGPKRSRKIPPKISRDISLPPKKIHRRASAGAPGSGSKTLRFIKR